ncbi:hypothetical protein BDC45DRAFT_535547 [Circinella umbellata]|nr:hypothetical protein BDC45DRAFT_535547 [Circinella umbellata]
MLSLPNCAWTQFIFDNIGIESVFEHQMEPSNFNFIRVNEKQEVIDKRDYQSSNIKQVAQMQKEHKVTSLRTKNACYVLEYLKENTEKWRHEAEVHVLFTFNLFRIIRNSRIPIKIINCIIKDKKGLVSFYRSDNSHSIHLSYLTTVKDKSIYIQLIGNKIEGERVKYDNNKRKIKGEES